MRSKRTARASPATEKNTANREAEAMTPQSVDEIRSAMEAGMVKRAMTRMSPATRIVSTTASEMRATTRKWRAVTGTPLVLAKSSS